MIPPSSQSTGIGQNRRGRPLQYYLEAIAGQALDYRGDADTRITGVTTDSREVKPGYIFIAIPGTRQDGARFIPDALARGADTIVAENHIAVTENANFVRVKNSYTTAALLAEAVYDYPADSLKLIGITGTNGKTTSACLLRDILKHAGFSVGLINTVHYEIGGKKYAAGRTTPMPFELQKLLAEMRDEKIEYVILEASSHALSQHRMGRAKFQGALFTNLSPDHGDYHETMENYFNAKKILFTEYLGENAVAAINLNDEYGQRLACELSKERSKIRIATFSSKPEPGRHIHIHDFQTSVDGLHLQLVYNDKTLPPLTSGLIGSFNMENITGAVCLMLEMGVGFKPIAEAVESFEEPPGRLQRLAGRNCVRVFVDYAHTNDALANVLRCLRESQPAFLTVVFGCGGDRDRTKRPVMGETAERLADKVIVTSDNPRSEEPADIINDIMTGIRGQDKVEIIEDRQAAIRHAITEARPGEVVLIAGKGHEKFQEIKGENFPFDDVEEARAAFTAE